LIIRLIIQTIRQDPTGSDQIDDPSNLSSPDPSGADQIDAEHQATDLAVGEIASSQQAVGRSKHAAARIAAEITAGPTRSAPSSLGV
jgi:hypothetical protein